MVFDASSDARVRAAVGRHLAFAPVAFAVTEGPKHALLYANQRFLRMHAAGELTIGASDGHGPSAAELTPLLDEAYRTVSTIRDVLLPSEPPDPSWSCTVWPVPSEANDRRKLVIEVRDVRSAERKRSRQRLLTERLLIAALREQDAAADSDVSNRHASFLVQVGRDLAASLDEATTRETIRRLTLPRAGTWCIVDVVEPDGTIQRLPVVHADPELQRLARQLDVNAQLLATYGESNADILRTIGFGSLLVVPLISRGRTQGTLTFISNRGEEPYTAAERTLAVDLAGLCAMALDNARLYRESIALRRIAEEANRAKTQFLGGMSHELRTPLNAIAGFAQLIDMGIHGPVTAEQHEALSRIGASQEHLLSLVNELLNFARIDSGRVEYRAGEVSLSRLMADVQQMLPPVMAEKELTCHGRGHVPGPVAWADAERVKQILINLVMNAVKYTQRGGAITLTCAVRDNKAIACVGDTGPGIGADELERIFEPFVQLGDGYKDRRGGVGLGLAISRDLARGMDGDILVESTVGQGSRFTLVLPRARASS